MCCCVCVCVCVRVCVSLCVCVRGLRMSRGACALNVEVLQLVGSWEEVKVGQICISPALTECLGFLCACVSCVRARGCVVCGCVRACVGVLFVQRGHGK